MNDIVKDENKGDRDGKTGLKREELRQVVKRTAPRAVIVHEAIRREGHEELKRTPSALGWSGLAAGLSMGFSMVAVGLLQSHLPDAPWQPLVSKLGYSIGFLFVILGRQQLFTENTLTPVLPLLHSPEWSTLFQVARLWLVVLVANMAGTFLFAWIVSHTAIFKPEVLTEFTSSGLKALEGSFGVTFYRAVFAGWLIALTIWLLPFAETAKVGVIIIVTYMIGLGGFNHIIAGSVDVFFVNLTGAAAWGDSMIRFFIPTLLGNVFGGVALVAAVNHAQVVSGEED